MNLNRPSRSDWFPSGRIPANHARKTRQGVTVCLLTSLAMVLAAERVCASPPLLFPKHIEVPHYPVFAVQALIEGIVTVTCLLERGGKVASCKLIQGHPLLGKYSVDTSTKWTFFTDDSLAQDSLHVSLTYEYRLEGYSAARGIRSDVTEVTIDLPYHVRVRTVRPLQNVKVIGNRDGPEVPAHSAAEKSALTVAGFSQRRDEKVSQSWWPKHIEISRHLFMAGLARIPGTAVVRLSVDEAGAVVEGESHGHAFLGEVSLQNSLGWTFTSLPADDNRAFLTYEYREDASAYERGSYFLGVYIQVSIDLPDRILVSWKAKAASP